MSGPWAEGNLPEILLIACRPVDITGLPSVPGIDLRAIVTIEHSRILCDHCERPCWIGPRQQARYDAELDRSERVCYFCMINILRESGELGDDLPIISLGGGNAPSRGV